MRIMFYLRSLIFILVLNISSSYAGLDKAPPSFIVDDKKAIWIDFINAKYNLSFDLKSKKSTSIATIEFEIREKGYPIFDIVGKPSSVIMDGVGYGDIEINTPGFESKVRIINRELSPGTYTVRIVTPISRGVKFGRGNVSVGFFNKDMRDRHFLERYIPTNYEYDQYKMEILIKIIGSSKKHRLFTNGHLVETSGNTFHFTYPEYFTSSSLYFHLVPKNKFKVLEFVYESRLRNGRDFPVTIYSKMMRLSRKVKKKVIKVLRELEGDYGPWPHPELTFYADGKWKGGMEYAGAATSGWFAIGHELQHNYFARAVMPANGNAGWVDEAVASWRDFYTLNKLFSFGRVRMNYVSMNLGNQSVYNRKSDIRSYKSGRSFIFYLDSLLKKSQGKSFKKFLKKYFENRKYTVIDSEDFRLDLERYSGRSFKKLFDQYIYGLDHRDKSISSDDHSFHTPLSDEEIWDLI